MSKHAGVAATGAARFGRAPVLLQWIVLFATSLLVGVTLETIGIPAALLLGPMFAGIAASVLGAQISVPRFGYHAAQAVVGCLIASTFKPSTIVTIAQNWAVLLSVVAATYFVSLALGFAMSRLRILPGSTAVWGSAPGAASAMMLMAESTEASILVM